MDNLITKSNFTGLIALVGTDQTWINSDLDAYITQYQEILLKKFLGEHLYNLLDTNYVADNGDKWDLLVKGDTYTKEYNGNDYTIKYKGLKVMLADFIYFYYKSELATQATEGGEVVSNYKNSTNSKVDRKAIKAFNLGVDLLGEILDFDGIDYVEIGDLPFFTNNLTVDPLKPTLFNYITFKNEEDDTTYLNWIFSSFNKINELGI